MTEATTLYIIRHGKTMFNTIGRTKAGQIPLNQTRRRRHLSFRLRP